MSDREAENKRRQKISFLQGISELSKQTATLYSATQRIISKSQNGLYQRMGRLRNGGTLYMAFSHNTMYKKPFFYPLAT